MIDLEWMAWTWPTAIFFIGIALLLSAMTVWEVVQPSVERRGLLPIATTRGDRLFIGLLGSAFIHLAWLGLVSGTKIDLPGLGPTDLNLWWAFGLSIVYMVALMRWG
jgi:predicted small integral membrane protein